jgi:hypothetical protein
MMATEVGRPRARADARRPRRRHRRRRHAGARAPPTSCCDQRSTTPTSSRTSSSTSCCVRQPSSSKPRGAACASPATRASFDPARVIQPARALRGRRAPVGERDGTEPCLAGMGCEPNKHCRPRVPANPWRGHRVTSRLPTRQPLLRQGKRTQRQAPRGLRGPRARSEWSIAGTEARAPLAWVTRSTDASADRIPPG